MRPGLVVIAAIAVTLSGQPAAARPLTPGPMTDQRLPVKAALSGHALDVYEATGLNPDCSQAAPLTFRIVRPGRHGKLSIGVARVYPTYPASNVRSICNSRALPGWRGLYTSAQGYVGPDEVEFQVFSPLGAARDITIPINVR